MNTNTHPNIGIKIQTLRKMRGFTQEQLAEKIGKAVESVSNIERGKKLPSFLTLDAIRIALDVTLYDLLDNSRADTDREITTLRAKARDIVNQLDKADLRLAVSQLEALLKHRK